jgi:hypothetical protein
VVGEGDEDVGPSARIVRTGVRRERREMRRRFILARLGRSMGVRTD